MHNRIAINSQCFGVGERAPTWTELSGYLRELRPRRFSYGAVLAGTDPTPLGELLDTSGCKLESIVHPFFSGRALDPREESWGEERAKLSQAIEIAAAHEARAIYMATGGLGQLTWEEAATCFSAAIAPCVAEAQAAGVALTIENTLSLYADIHIAHSLRDTVALAEMSGIGLCMDIFACWTEAGLKETLVRAMPRLGLVQVTDYIPGDRSVPARAVPGDGAIPLKRIFEWTLSAGYGGAFEIEILGPRIDKEGYLDATRRAAVNVNNILCSLGV